MKVLLFLVSLVFINSGCCSSKKEQDHIAIEYSAHSRGLFKQIIIANKSVSIINNREDIATTKTYSESNWNLLLEAIKSVDIENITNLKAPSEKRFYDGAAIANFKITLNGKSYETSSFDHGNPPKEIEKLINQVLSISESIE